MSRETWKYKTQAEVAARQLGYSKEVQEQVSKATTENEIYRIMNNARRAFLYT